MKPLRSEVLELVHDVLSDMPRDDCRTCDCWLGFVTQLEMDSRDDLSDIANLVKIPRAQMHGCLGCDPCPPAEAFADYLRKDKDAKAKDGRPETSPCRCSDSFPQIGDP